MRGFKIYLVGHSLARICLVYRAPVIAPVVVAIGTSNVRLAAVVAVAHAAYPSPYLGTFGPLRIRSVAGMLKGRHGCIGRGVVIFLVPSIKRYQSA